MHGSQGQYLNTQQKKLFNMLRVIINDGEKIDRALKQFKRKCNNTKLIQELRSRKEFEKPSVKARKQRLRAEYVQKLRNEEE